MIEVVLFECAGDLCIRISWRSLQLIEGYKFKKDTMDDTFFVFFFFVQKLAVLVLILLWCTSSFLWAIATAL